MRPLPVPVEELHKLICQALLDLRKARRNQDARRMLRAEARMNALLDTLSRRASRESVTA